MIRVLEFAGFVALAAAMHAGLWTVAPQGAGSAGGTGGADGVTLEASTPQMDALVAAWQRPVALQPRAARPAVPPSPQARPVLQRPRSAPAINARPQAPAMAALPRDDLPGVAPPAPRMPVPPLALAAPRLVPPQTRAAPAPVAPAPTPGRAAPRRPAPAPRMAAPAADPPQVQTTTPAPQVSDRPAPRPTPPHIRPVARPERPPVQSAPAPATQRPSPARAQEQARGSGAQTASGMQQTGSAARLDAATRRSLMADWGGGIRTRIERRKRYPDGTRASGTVHLTLTVAGTGRLRAVTVRTSSGDAALDRAALRAVQRARLPAKPGALPGDSHRFNLPVTFRR